MKGEGKGKGKGGKRKGGERKGKERGGELGEDPLDLLPPQKFPSYATDNECPALRRPHCNSTECAILCRIIVCSFKLSLKIEMFLSRINK